MTFQMMTKKMPKKLHENFGKKKIYPNFVPHNLTDKPADKQKRRFVI